MSIDLPETEHIRLRLEEQVLWLTLDRPDRRNAMSFRMVREVLATLAAVEPHPAQVRSIVFRGAGGHFCAGGDIADMAAARQAEPGPDGRDPVAVGNRLFGAMLQAIEAAPQAVIAVCEGAVMGGGFGLACVADLTFAVEGARFRLPETGLGISPAQIMPFVVRRIGLTEARRFAVTGEGFGARRAVQLGLAHTHLPEASDLGKAMARELALVRRCAPGAVAVTKRLALSVGSRPLDAILDDAAEDFARLVRSEEAVAGMQAFFSGEPPPWAPEVTEESP